MSAPQTNRMVIAVNATGHRCPMPILLMEKALRSVPAPDAVKVIADDPLAAIDIPHFANAQGFSATRLEGPSELCVFLVTAKEKPRP